VPYAAICCGATVVVVVVMMMMVAIARTCKATLSRAHQSKATLHTLRTATGRVRASHWRERSKPTSVVCLDAAFELLEHVHHRVARPLLHIHVHELELAPSSSHHHWPIIIIIVTPARHSLSCIAAAQFGMRSRRPDLVVDIYAVPKVSRRMLPSPLIRVLPSTHQWHLPRSPDPTSEHLSLASPLPRGSCKIAVEEGLARLCLPSLQQPCWTVQNTCCAVSRCQPRIQQRQNVRW
jgi:hypothetical protein